MDALRELRHVLRPGGALVLSRLHPTGDWLRHPDDDFADRLVDETWNRGWRVRYWIGPLERTTEELHEAGFLIERLREPRHARQGEVRRPDAYAEIVTSPVGFMAIRAMRRD